MDKYRALVYQIFHYGLTSDEFNCLKDKVTKEGFFKSANTNSFQFTNFDRTGFCEALEKIGVLHKNDLSGLKSLVGSIHREDLVWKIEQFENEAIEGQKTAVELKQGRTRTTSKLFNNTIVLISFLSTLSISIWFEYQYGKVWYWYRYYRCTYGGIKNSTMSFRFTTFDLQDAEVE